MDSKEMPKLISTWREMSLIRFAYCFIRAYEELILPILFKFGVSDDKRIQKYLNEASMEAVYKDAVATNPERVKFLEGIARYTGEDLYKLFRSNNSKAMSPDEEGFIFAPLPYAEDERRAAVTKALTVKRGTLNLNKDVLLKAAVITPTSAQRELYAILADFCEVVNNRYPKKSLGELLIQSNGKIHPNIGGIIGRESYKVIK